MRVDAEPQAPEHPRDGDGDGGSSLGLSLGRPDDRPAPTPSHDTRRPPTAPALVPSPPLHEPPQSHPPSSAPPASASYPPPVPARAPSPSPSPSTISSFAHLQPHNLPRLPMTEHPPPAPSSSPAHSPQSQSQFLALLPPREHAHGQEQEAHETQAQMVEMDVNVGQLPPVEEMPFNPEDDGTAMLFDDEGLSELEKIFLFARSEQTVHRRFIASTLGESIKHVDPAEAVEYVLPLLNGLGTDPEDEVRIAFAPQLAFVVYYFLTNFPLVELQPFEEYEGVEQAGEEGEGEGEGEKTTSLTVTSESLRTVSMHRTLSDQAVPSLPPSFDNATSPSSSDPSPRSFDDGTPGSATSASTAASSVHQTTPPLSDAPCSASASSGQAPTAAAADEGPIQAIETDYYSDVDSHADGDVPPCISVTTFTPLIGSLLLNASPDVAVPARRALVLLLARLRGRPLPEAEYPEVHDWPAWAEECDARVRDAPDLRDCVEGELVGSIVLGLARLDEEEMEGGGADRSRDSWASVSSRGEGSTGASEPPRSRGPSSGWEMEESVGAAGVDGEERWRRVGELDEQAHEMGAARGDPMLDCPEEEASLGRMVTMSLIAEIVSSGVLDGSDTPEKLFLPEVHRLKDDPAYYVRREAAFALGGLAKAVPLEHVHQDLIPLINQFARDPVWQVRQSACLALHSLASALPSPYAKRAVVLPLAQSFARDSFQSVRAALLESLGQLVALFIPSASDNDSGAGNQEAGGDPPAELVDLFLGRADRTSTTAPEPEAERQLVAAYNLPAFVLALGRARWEEVRGVHRFLCGSQLPKVRRSLAASLADIARILGPTLTARDLLQSFTAFLADVPEVRERAIERFSHFVRALPAPEALAQIRTLRDDWDAAGWRLREALAGQVADLAEGFAGEDREACVLAAWAKALRDPVGAVRDAGVRDTWPFYQALRDVPERQQQLLAQLSALAHDETFKHRRTFLACCSAYVSRPDADRPLFEAQLLPSLVRLGNDAIIDVRISVAQACREAIFADRIYTELSHRPPSFSALLLHLDADPTISSIVPGLTIPLSRRGSARTAGLHSPRKRPSPAFNGASPAQHAPKTPNGDVPTLSLPASDADADTIMASPDRRSLSRSPAVSPDPRELSFFPPFFDGGDGSVEAHGGYFDAATAALAAPPPRSSTPAEGQRGQTARVRA